MEPVSAHTVLNGFEKVAYFVGRDMTATPITGAKNGPGSGQDDEALSTTAGAPPEAKAHWAGVISLGLGIFSIVMAEFLPASLLPRMAEDLGVTAGAAGQPASLPARAFAQ